jgi:hypothetical protein
MLAEAEVMLEEESALTSAEAAAILANISSGRVLRISNTSALFLQNNKLFFLQINFVETRAPAQHYWRLYLHTKRGHED